jgi:hypothetical protein
MGPAGFRASARGNLHTTGKLQRPRRTREQKGILKEGGKSAGTGAHGWGPRASARGNPQRKGGNRNHSGSTVGALARARGENHGGRARGENCKQRGKPQPRRGRVGALAQARGETRIQRGNCKDRGEPASKREFSRKAGNPQAQERTVGALARARGETCKQKGGTATTAGARLGPSREREGKPAYNGETAKTAENPRAKGNSQGRREIRRHRSARLGPSRKREGKPGV